MPQSQRLLDDSLYGPMAIFLVVKEPEYSKYPLWRACLISTILSSRRVMEAMNARAARQFLMSSTCINLYVCACLSPPLEVCWLT